MKKKSVILIYVMIILVACQNNEKSSKQFRHTSETGKIVKKQIIGLWRLIDDEFVSMIIKQDSIYYPDQQETCNYTVLENSIIIFDKENFSDTINFKMKGMDTLIFIIADNPQLYIRNAK